MKLYPLMRTWALLWVDASPEVVAQRLAGAVARGELRGRADSEQFSVSAPAGGRNSWRPQLSGTLRPISGGTAVEVRAAVKPLVLAFTVIHGFLLFGIAWLMGIGAFSWEVDGALEVLRRAAGATGAAAPLSDPLSEGAEAGAPWSLRPHADLDGVHLTVLGANRWTGSPRETPLRLGRGGVSIGDDEIPWHDVAEAAAGGGVLRLGGREVDCRGHSEAHVRWLVDYLRGKAARLAASEAEREAFLDSARRLAAAARRATGR